MSEYFTQGPTVTELLIAARLRALCLEEMDKRTDEELMELFDIFKSGLDRWRWRSVWSLSHALRVAQVLHLPVIKEMLLLLGAEVNA